MGDQVSSAVQIYWTKDYGKFKFMRGNRDLNDLKVKRIKRSVENGLEFFRFCPIMVNEDMYIIDGQHRFWVCKEMKLNIYYVIVPDFSLRQIAEINNNTTKWKDQDYLNCYIDVGVEDYKVLASFMEKYSLRIGVAAALLHTGTVPTGGNIRDEFRDGMFRCAFLDKATELMDRVVQFNEFTALWHKRSFIKAVEILNQSSVYNQDEFVEKLRLHNLQIEPRSTHKEYLQHMEELFNFRNSKRRVLYQ